jgi:hypothetical protein
MTGEWGPTTVRTFDLGHEQLLMLEGRAGTRVRVIFGGVWLTESGEPDDVFAFSGEEVALRHHRRTLLESLGASRIEVAEPAARRATHALARGIAMVARGIARRLGALRPARAWTPQVPRGTLAVLAAVVGIAIPALVAVGITMTAPTLAQFV